MKIQRFRHTSILCARLINYTSPFISGDICCWKVSFSHQTSWQVRPQGRRVCQSLLKQYWQEIRTERCSSSQNINATSCASFYLSSNLKPSAPEQKPWPAELLSSSGFPQGSCGSLGHGGIQNTAWKIHLMQNPKGRWLRTMNIFWQCLSQEHVSKDSTHSATCNAAPLKHFLCSPTWVNFCVQRRRCPAKPVLCHSSAFLRLPLCSKPGSFKSGQTAVGS